MIGMALRVLVCGCAGLALALVSGCETTKSGDPGAEIVAMAKAATGAQAWDRIEILHDAGQIVSVSGETTSYEHWTDVRTLSTRAGSESGYMIYDGRVAYQCSNAQCIPRTELDPRFVREGAYLAAFGFFFPDRFPARFRYKGERMEGDALYDTVEVSPAGLASIDLWVDHRTHRIFRFVYDGGQARTDLFDYRKVGALMIPFSSVTNGVTVRSALVRLERAGVVSFSALSHR